MQQKGGGKMTWDFMFSQIILFLVVVAPACSAAGGGVQLVVQGPEAVIDNGIVKVTLSVPDGCVTDITYNGIENVLEPVFEKSERGYWDMNWASGPDGLTDKITSTTFKIIKEEKDQVELSFSSVFGKSAGGTAYPVNIDKRFVMLSNSSGFHCYGIFERLKGFPKMNIFEARIAFKLDKTKFRYVAVSDTRQRIMPEYADRHSGKALAYPEAVLLTSPADPAIKGEVDDKYMYSTDNRDGKVHGWVSSDPSVGFWMITPSNEFKSGGPLKQDLTSHTGPITLSMFVSLHYAGLVSGLYFEEGAPWKKVFGPVFVYLNTNADKDPASLWTDAKAQLSKEVDSWPYAFPVSADYLAPDQRGSVTGKLRVCDPACGPAANASVGLATPGDAGSWQLEGQGYQFWVETDAEGAFTIKGVRPGTYDLFGWVTGVIGDYKHTESVVVAPGAPIDLGELTYTPPRSGATLWEIGTPDRTAAEFHIPDPKPTLTNPLLLENDRFRQYGLWLQYTELYPKEDIAFTVGTSVASKDWFYAHVNRVNLDSTTWKIIFNLTHVLPNQDYVLRVALASSNGASLAVRVNTPIGRPLFTTGQVGEDNAIARHGIHGIYRLYNATIPSAKLVEGSNTLFLTQTKNTNLLQGLMYDYLRLEGPSDTPV